MYKLFIGFFLILMSTSCGQKDASEYDVRSPCVSAYVTGEGDMNLEVPCQRRLPLENSKGMRIIAVS